MDKASAIETVKKLLYMSQCSTADEASTAAYMAQRLISRFDIDQALIELTSGNAPVTEDLTETIVYKFDGPRTISWIINLGVALAKANSCKLWYIPSYGCGRAWLEAAGRATDLDTVTYMIQYLAVEIERASERALTKRRMNGERSGKSWSNSFKLGAVSMIQERLEAARRSVAEEVKATAVEKPIKALPGETSIPVVTYQLATINEALATIEARYKRADEWATKKHKLRAGPRRSATRYGEAWGPGSGSRF